MNSVQVDRFDELCWCGQSSSTLSMQSSSTLSLITLLSIRDFSCFYINRKQKNIIIHKIQNITDYWLFELCISKIKYQILQITIIITLRLISFSLIYVIKESQITCIMIISYSLYLTCYIRILYWLIWLLSL